MDFIRAGQDSLEKASISSINLSHVRMMYHFVRPIAIKILYHMSSYNKLYDLRNKKEFSVSSNHISVFCLTGDTESQAVLALPAEGRSVRSCGRIRLQRLPPQAVHAQRNLPHHIPPCWWVERFLFPMQRS